MICGKWLDAQRDTQLVASSILLNAAEDWNAALNGRTPNGMARSDAKTAKQREAILAEIRIFFRGTWGRTLCECCGINAERMLDRLEDKYSASALRHTTLEEGRANA